MVVGFSWMVRVMNTLSRYNGEPSSVGAIIINHMVSPNPHELVALVQVQFGQRWFVPPILLILAAATVLSTICWRHRHGARARVDLEVLVGGNEGCVAPICLHTTTLRGPIVRVPDRAVHAHGLVLREGNALVFQVRVHPYWRLIHQETVYIQIDMLPMLQFLTTICRIKNICKNENWRLNMRKIPFPFEFVFIIEWEPKGTRWGQSLW